MAEFGNIEQWGFGNRTVGSGNTRARFGKITVGIGKSTAGFGKTRARFGNRMAGFEVQNSRVWASRTVGFGNQKGTSPLQPQGEGAGWQGAAPNPTGRCAKPPLGTEQEDDTAARVSAEFISSTLGYKKKRKQKQNTQQVLPLPTHTAYFPPPSPSSNVVVGVLAQDDEALEDGGDGHVLLRGQLCPLAVRQQHRGGVGLEAGDGFGLARLAHHIHSLPGRSEMRRGHKWGPPSTPTPALAAPSPVPPEPRRAGAAAPRQR